MRQIIRKSASSWIAFLINSLMSVLSGARTHLSRRIYIWADMSGSPGQGQGFSSVTMAQEHSPRVHPRTSGGEWRLYRVPSSALFGDYFNFFSASTWIMCLNSGQCNSFGSHSLILAMASPAEAMSFCAVSVLIGVSPILATPS